MTEQENKSLDAVSSWLKQSAKNKDWQYFNYSEEVDFAQLWEIGTGTGVRDKTSPLLVDWNGFPDEHPSFPKILEFITPLDWALAVAYKQVAANPTAPGLPQVIIVDRCSHRYPGSFAVEMRRAMADALPHVKVFSALSDDDNEDALAFIRFLQIPITSAKQSRLGQMQALRQAWIGYTVQSGDHHDLSNILGPLVLSTGFKDSTLRNGLLKDKSAQALLQKIKWSDMGGGDGDPKDKWFDFSQHAAKIIRDSRVKIILVDDQANQGWLDIVSAAVGAVRPDASQASEDEIKLFAKSAVVDVWASTSYQAIKSRLEAAGISDKEGSTISGDQRFKFNLTGEGAEILLLDLRLLSNEQEEIKYFRWALGVAKNLKRANEAAFPGMDCDTLREWIGEDKKSMPAGWRKTAKYLELLTLLPRILATIDMSLPIIIFSSTGKREVTEWLKDYRNIITIFNKPGFFGYANESFVEDTKQKFDASMLAAIHILQARVAIQELLANFPPKDGMEPQIDGQPPQEKYVEIFIDESGEPQGGSDFVVAGVALVHNNVEQARKLHAEMENTKVEFVDECGTMKSVKLKWYGPGCMDKRISTNADQRKKLFQPVKSSLKTLFENHTGGFVSFAISSKFDQLKSSGKLKGLANHNLDCAYLELFEWLIDVVLYEFLPGILGYQSRLKFKIYGATRMRPKDSRTVFSPVEKAALHGDWGISGVRETTDKKTGETYGLYQALGEMSFMPLVVNVLSGRPSPKAGYMRDGSSVVGTVGFSLKYYPDEPASYPIPRDFFRHAHYIADLVANSVLISLTTPTRDMFDDFFNHRFIDAFDDSFKAAVDASKYLESDQRAEGFLRAVGAGRYHVAYRKRSCPESIVDTILSKISGEVGKLTTGEFYKFSADLNEWWHDNDDPSAIGRLPGKAYGEDSYSGLRAGKNMPKSQRPANQKATSRERQNKNHGGAVGNSSLSQNPGLFITLAGLNENLTDGQIKEIVEEVLRKESAYPIGLSIDITKSKNTKKMVCKIGSIPEHEYENVYKKLSKAKGDGTWRSCDKQPLPKKENFSVAQYKAPHSSVGQSQCHLDGDGSGYLAKINDQPTEQGQGDVVEKLPLGKNELRIKFKDSVGEDGMPYAVLDSDNGIPCAVLSMVNGQLTDCEIGQIVIVESMHSNRHIKVSHSEFKLSVLEFVGQAHQVPNAN